MIDAYTDPDEAANLLERRWFAAFKAASAARAECEALLEALATTEIAWERAREQLVNLEALRDALGNELAILDAADEVSALPRSRRVMSAA